jgi:hypothetical protein
MNSTLELLTKPWSAISTKSYMIFYQKFFYLFRHPFDVIQYQFRPEKIAIVKHTEKSVIVYFGFKKYLSNAICYNTNFFVKEPRLYFALISLFMRLHA